MNPYASTFPTSLPTLLPLYLASRCAWRAARRGWQHARALQHRAATEREGLRQLNEMDDRMLSDIGVARCDLPWMSQRDAYAALLDDVGAYHRAWGVHGPAAPRSNWG